MHGRIYCQLGAIIATSLLIGGTTTPAEAFWGQHCGSTCNECASSCDQCAGCDSGCASSSTRMHDFCEHIKTGRQINSMWPYPYVCADRVWAHAPFDAMVANGWRRQNLLGAHHFHPETGKLTRAGELKVEWILTQTPPQHRQVFVERSMDPSVTEDRVAQAEAFANNIQLDGEALLVQETHVRSPSRAASMVDAERSSFIQGRPPAVLPAGNSTTTSN